MSKTSSGPIRTVVLVVLGLIWLAPVYLLIVNASKSVDGYDAASVWKPAGFSLFGELRGRVGARPRWVTPWWRRRCTAWCRRCSRC